MANKKTILSIGSSLHYTGSILALQWLYTCSTLAPRLHYKGFSCTAINYKGYKHGIVLELKYRKSASGDLQHRKSAQNILNILNLILNPL